MKSLLFSIYSLFFVVLTAHAINSSNQNSNARRSLLKNHRNLRRQLDLSPLLGGFGGNGNDDTPSSTSSNEDGAPNPDSTSSDPKTTPGLLAGILNPLGDGLGGVGTTLVSGLGDIGNALTSTTSLLQQPTTSLVEPVSTTASDTVSNSTSATDTEATIAPSTDASAPTTTDASTPTSTSTDGGILGTIIGGLTSALGPSPTPTSDTNTSETTGGTDTSGTTAGTDTSGTTPGTDAATDTSGTTTGTDVPTDTTSTGGGILSSVIGGLTSALNPSPTTDSTPTTDPTDTAPPTSVTAPTDTPSPSSSDGGILSSVIGGLSSVLDPSTPSSTISSPPDSVTPSDPPLSAPPSSVPPSSVPPSSVPPSSVPPSSSDGGIISSIISILDPPSSVPPSSVPPSSLPPSSLPPSSLPPSSLPPSSLPPSSVPSASVTVLPSSSGFSSALSGSSSDSILQSSSKPSVTFPSNSRSVVTQVSTSTAVVTTVVSIASEFSFLTGSSLVFTSVSLSTPTITNPDEATTTVSQTGSAAAPINTAPLPSGLPYRIMPSSQLDTTQKFTGYTLISILFNNELNWPFVVDNSLASSQIFAYLPVILQNSLGISADQVKTWVEQVYIPSSYRGPQDADELQTMFLGYIPTNTVDELAAQIKVKTSAFYTSTNDAVAQALAQRVDSGFSLLSVQDPGSGDKAPGQSNSNNDNNGASSDSSRQDTIIGVTVSLGVVAVLILAFLVFRSHKRRQEAAHRRLSDPIGGQSREGREFDQDSIGGQRRRSFYFAEDSLRGFQGEGSDGYTYTYDAHTDSQMSQRRPVVMPSAISAPILRESSMNW